MSTNASLERRIIIGLIVSTDYIQQVLRIWKPEYLQSSIAKTLGIWCMEYYEKYEKAPHSNIEGIYIEKLRNGSISKDIAEEIEEDILPDLSEEYERVEMFNVQYLLDQTRTYFRERQLLLHSEEIKALIDQNEIEEAETKAEAFNSQPGNIEIGLELGSEESLEDVDAAFNQTTQRVLTYPGALGEMWNDQMARGNFVALMGPEKRGKCLPGDQKIMMATGEMISINDVIKNNRTDVISFNENDQCFEKTNISKFWKNGIKDVYKVTTRTGRSVQVTGNHPFLTPDGWRDLETLDIGKFIAVPKDLPIFGKEKMPDYKIKLLAYFITEGCVREYRGKNGVSKNVGFCSAEKEIQDDFTESIYKMECDVRWDG
ncbi:MAG TPA: hypothetical protein VK982_01635, partial [Bacteroidales bacterium]|nr:hypothetical protein [Bacteroidales bacterium]